jgi:lysophospholipase L1-like esterase
MKTILCFGDSNTWGFDPAATVNSPFPVRYAPDVRWTGVMARELGAEYRIIEEAQNGRTAVLDDGTVVACRNAKRYLPTCLDSHKPIDLVVLMLGTNDVKAQFSQPVADVANGVALLVKMILQSESGPNAKAPRVLLVAPPAIGEKSGIADFDTRFAGSREKSLHFPRLYSTLAKQLGVSYASAQDFVQPSDIDGIHLDRGEMEKLGLGIAGAVCAIF